MSPLQYVSTILVRWATSQKLCRLRRRHCKRRCRWYSADARRAASADIPDTASVTLAPPLRAALPPPLPGAVSVGWLAGWRGQATAALVASEARLHSTAQPGGGGLRYVRSPRRADTMTMGHWRQRGGGGLHFASGAGLVAANVRGVLGPSGGERYSLPAAQATATAPSHDGSDGTADGTVATAQTAHYRRETAAQAATGDGGRQTAPTGDGQPQAEGSVALGLH